MDVKVDTAVLDITTLRNHKNLPTAQSWSEINHPLIHWFLKVDAFFKKKKKENHSYQLKSTRAGICRARPLGSPTPRGSLAWSQQWCRLGGSGGPTGGNRWRRTGCSGGQPVARTNGNQETRRDGTGTDRDQDTLGSRLAAKDRTRAALLGFSRVQMRRTHSLEALEQMRTACQRLG